MFSKTCEYAIRACIYIASQSYQDNRVTIKDIADEINSPQSFTAKILQTLAKHKLVHSVKGIGGGFEIPKEALSQISLAQIVIAVDGDGFFANCGLGVDHCSEEHPCPLYKKFLGIRKEMNLMLESTNLEELAINIKAGEAFLM